MKMLSPNVWSRFAGVAVVLALAGLSGCMDDDDSSDNNNSSGSVGGAPASPLNWVNTSTTAAAPTGDTPLAWIDPNLGPANTGGGGQGDKTFSSVDPINWPIGSPNADHPVVVALALSTNEEFAIEGQAFIYRSSLIAGGGGPNNAAVVVLPGLFGNQTKLSAVARALSKHVLIHVPTEMPPIALLDFSLKANAVNGVGTFYTVLPLANLDAPGAWGIMVQAGVQFDVVNGGYMGGGYWASATMESYTLIFTLTVP